MDPSHHAENRNWLESLALYIPGFKGYLKKEYRRDADYLVRKSLADRLQSAKPHLDSYMRSQIDAGVLDGLPLCERVRSRIDTLINTIRSAERGYSGVFDFVKVQEPLLDQVYQHDLSLVKDIDAAVEACEALANSPEPPAQAIPPVLKQLDTVEKQFAKRSELLAGVGPESQP